MESGGIRQSLTAIFTNDQTKNNTTYQREREERKVGGRSRTLTLTALCVTKHRTVMAAAPRLFESTFDLSDVPWRRRQRPQQDTSNTTDKKKLSQGRSCVRRQKGLSKGNITWAGFVR